MSEQTGERLQKALARAGFGSRRACEDLIRKGRVRVNGKPVTLGRRVDAERDIVTVNGQRATISITNVYFALNKPVGVVSTAHDPRHRPKVLDLVPKDPRVFPVGRLDIDTSGLLLLTNDGEFANHIAHPRYGVPKTYVAQVKGSAGASVARKLVRGVELDDGEARAESAKLEASGRGSTLIEVTVREGRNRLVRRMLEKLNFEVLTLSRIAIGEVRLGRLKEGDWRTLKPNEVRDLMGPPTEVDEPGA